MVSPKKGEAVAAQDNWSKAAGVSSFALRTAIMLWIRSRD